MLALLSLLILLLIPVILLLLRLVRPQFGLSWLVVVFGTFGAWLSVLLTRLSLPLELPLTLWQPADLFPYMPSLLVDRISWPISLGLVTITFAVLLADVVRQGEQDESPSERFIGDWSFWVGSMLVTAMGLLAVWAGNPLTLLLGWFAVDLIELLILLSQGVKPEDTEQVIIKFSARLGGIVLVSAAGMIAQSQREALDFTNTDQTISLLLVIAAGLRLGVIPLHAHMTRELRLRRSLGTLLRMVPAAASLILLARSASAGPVVIFRAPLLALTFLAASYAGVFWQLSKDEVEGRPYWLLGTSSLALSAAILGKGEASLAWGLALMLPGSLLFLASIRRRLLIPVMLIELISLLMLPFTPTWMGAGLWSSPVDFQVILLLPATVLLAGGYARHAFRPGAAAPGLERWVWLIYPAGLGLLAAAHWIAVLWGGLFPDVGSEEFNWIVWIWPGIVILLLLVTGLTLYQRGIRFPTIALHRAGKVLGLGWFYRVIWGIFISVRRLFSFIDLVLEGDGGILWAMLLLALLLSLIFQVQTTGGV